MPVLQTTVPFLPHKDELWYLSLPILINYRHKNLKVVHNITQIPTFFKFKNVKYIITVHDLIPVLFPKEVKLGYHLFFRVFLPRTLKSADRIIVDSNHTKEDLSAHYNISKDKITVIYLAADPRYRLLDEDRIHNVKDKYGIKLPYILYVGSMERRKNIPLLLKAFLEVKNNIPHKLVIVGSKGKHFNSITKLVHDYNLQDDVIFTGRVPDEDMPSIYNLAELFVYPSLYEGFGLPPLEAMACGCPVITSNVSSLPEVVGDAGILIDPNNVNELSCAIYKALTDVEFKNSLKLKGLERANMFSWRKFAEETASIYEEFI
ncbi:MAG TPA: glycosyltransferase family 1 protein [Bacteroidales bacterium]|nr:glycosyltransferase family 1 protein [Bacteroidales bacterium]